MEEYGAVVSAILRLMRAVDCKDRELFRDSWAEDIDFEVTFFGQPPMAVRGRDVLVERFTTGWNGQPSPLRHQVGAVEVEAAGDGRAKARFYCSYFNVGPEATFAGLGEYEDELTKGPDGRWRVARRRHRFLSPLAH